MTSQDIPRTRPARARGTRTRRLRQEAGGHDRSDARAGGRGAGAGRRAQGEAGGVGASRAGTRAQGEGKGAGRRVRRRLQAQGGAGHHQGEMREARRVLESL